MMKLVVYMLALLTAGCRAASKQEDRIQNLPTFGQPTTPQYSGYLNASSACQTDCHIHYWLVTAEETSKRKNDAPLVLWLNGGPGASSMIGMVQEHGTVLVNQHGRLVQNPYHWNRYAHVLILESPFDVGFSYCDECGENSDTLTARANLAALVEFFERFPEYQDTPLYLTGESYAGVYLPTLAYKILQYNTQSLKKMASKFNLQGLMVGDPCTDGDAQSVAADRLWYAHQYGLVDDDLYHMLRYQCAMQVFDFLDDTTRLEESSANQTPDDEQCRMAYRKFLLSSSNAIDGKWRYRYIDRFGLFTPVTDTLDDAMESYFNREDVQVQMHVRKTLWKKHAKPFHYQKQYNACNHQSQVEAPSMIDFYRKLIPHIRVWIYNGDTDPAIPYEGTRKAVRSIGQKQLPGGSFRPWFYNHTATCTEFLTDKPLLFGPDLLPESTGVQFGGQVISYESNLTFVTIHGSGHLVPQFRPQAALHLLNAFLNGKDLSPPLPTDSELMQADPKEFEQILMNWTVLAKSNLF